METSSVTYKFYTTLSFSQASLETLWILLSSLFSTKSYSVLICSIFTVYTIGYTILFPIIFGAATGYINQAHKLYAMPQGDVVSLDSEHLSLCWVIDPLRLGWTNASDLYVEVGPNFSSIQSMIQPSNYTNAQLYFTTDRGQNQDPKIDSLEYTPGGWKATADISIWDHLRDYNGSDTQLDISRNFANIRAYALTAQLLRISLYPAGWLSNGPESSLESTQSAPIGSKRIDWLSTDKFACTNSTSNAPILSLEALEYIGPAQLGAGLSSSGKVSVYPFNETSFEKTQWSHFTLNQSISLDPGVIPYDSTIWLDDGPVLLAAPFLDVGYRCSGNTAFTKLGNCVCYKGDPISLDILSTDKSICNTAPGYVWGFSSYLTRLGLILEAVWMACCLICYLRLSLRSDLVNREPIRTAGTMRLALDCSESIRNDIGPDASTLSERDLAKRLKEFRISYDILHSEQSEDTAYRVASGKRPRGFDGRYSEELVRWERQLEPWEGIVPKMLAPLEDRLAKKLAHWDDRFDSINERVDPVGDAGNKTVDQAAAYMKEKFRSTKRFPTELEVYEDLNWRV